MQKRLFLALAIPQSLGMMLADYTTSLGLSAIRWTPPENLHLTLHFLGNVEKDHIPELVQLLSNAICQHIIFVLKFKQISLVPQQNPVRMVWVEYCNDDAYQAIFDDTKNIISPWAVKHGYRHEYDHDDIIPHITLGRFSPPCIKQTQPLPQLTIPDLLVDRVQLMESMHTPEGRVYTVLETFLLKK